MRGMLRFLSEQADQVGGAEINLRCQLLEIKILSQMRVNILDHSLYRTIFIRLCIHLYAGHDIAQNIV